MTRHETNLMFRRFQYIRFNPGTTNQRYGWGTRWTSILDDKVRTKGYRVIEEGLCGRTTVFDDPFRTERRGTEMLPAILESHRPVDTIVLMLGTNDCKSVYSATPEVIGQGIEQLLDQINTVNPDAKILLVSPIYLGERILIRNSIRILLNDRASHSRYFSDDELDAQFFC